MNADQREGSAGSAAPTRTLGLVYPPGGRRYSGMQLDFIGSVTEVAQAHDYDVLLTSGTEVADPPFQRLLDGLLEGHRVDGVIVMEIRLDDPRVDHLTALGVPFVCIGRTGVEKTWWVDLDFGVLSRACVRHLADLGHRRIAFVNRSEALFRSGYGPAHHGLEGFTEGMAELGLTGMAYLCDDDPAAGEACLEQILADDPETTAVVTMNEAGLGGLYRGLTRAGRVVPRDFSVAGVAAGPWAERVTPQLTAADVPAQEMGRIGVELMMERLGRPDAPPRHVLLRPLISLRASTGPCRSGPDADL
ncbi:LacI family DNA-binding transcriptional regulator [Streptomyces sp. NPDC059373]